MKANFNQPFKDVFGQTVLDAEGKPQIIGRHLGFTLFNLADLNKTPMNPEQKFMAYTLSVKIANATDDVELSEEEAKFIDKVAAGHYSAGAYGNIKKLITNKNN